MIVKERMSHPVKTIGPDVPVMEALKRMHKDRISTYPVVDARGKMLGLVSETDLLKASPSEATTLSVWEINSLLSKITVGKVMTHEVITITEDTVVEEAARIMVDNDIDGLPVMRGSELVGFISEGDLFSLFLEMLGARNAGIRVSVVVKETEGALYELSKALFEAGGNFSSFTAFLGETTETREFVFKVTGLSEEALSKVIEPHVEKILDMRRVNLI
ncbi:MAG: CBS domain-containing protein [Anaerolineae bacterium]|nr:CBS domain-containing protein [Anaerolineae bacterium]